MLANITKEEFCKKVENKVITKKYTYIDAVIAIQEEYGIDYSIVSKLLSQPLLEKLETEGKNLNLIKKTKTRLPFA
jgi:hypothetical protein